jgi:hypothetical protein
LTALTGLISNILALPFAWLAYLPLKYEVWIVKTLGNLPWASKTLEKFSGLWFFLWYLALGLAIYFLRKKLNAKPENNL